VTITEGGMGGACGTYGENRNEYGVWWAKLKERNYLKDLDVDGRIIINVSQ
jgi:hypothetical protein